MDDLERFADLPPLPFDHLTKGLNEILSEGVLDLPADFQNETDLFELGLDSMAIMQLLIQIENRFGLSVPAHAVTRTHFCTVDALAKLLSEISSSQELKK